MKIQDDNEILSAPRYAIEPKSILPEKLESKILIGFKTNLGPISVKEPSSATI